MMSRSRSQGTEVTIVTGAFSALIGRTRDSTYQMSGGRRLLSEIERSPHSHRVELRQAASSQIVHLNIK